MSRHTTCVLRFALAACATFTVSAPFTAPASGATRSPALEGGSAFATGAVGSNPSDGLVPLGSIQGVEGCAEPQFMRDQLGTVGQPFSFTESVGCLPGGETWSSAVIYWGDGTTSPGTIASVRSPSPPEAGFASVTVTGQHTYNQPGNFSITVAANDQAGQTYEGGWHTNAVIGPSSSPPTREIPPGSAPNGSKVTEPYKPPELPWANQSGKEGAERAVAEQRAKEREEQQAEEAATQRAAALKHAEEQVQQAAAEAAARRREEAEHPACRVPALRGDTLTAARRVLARAHCRLGAVHQPRRRRGPLVVSGQAPRRGKTLPAGAAVAVTLAPRLSNKAT